MPNPQLSGEMCLRLAPGVRTRFDAAGHVLLDAPDGTVVDLGPRGYATLSLFAQPLALGQAIERLEREAPSTDFAPAVNVVNMLIEEGALVPLEPGRPPASGWADPVEHARMLHDDRRTGDFLAALMAAVRPGDIVLDIGTGNGVLAVAAARAGARRVYAVEASDIADVAERVFAANGVADTITLVRGWSRLIELPEPADLLVAEIIGNEPLEEELLETTLDARHRLLKPEARLIPHRLTLLARPLRLPDGDARQRAIGGAAVERWRQLYGMEFQPLLDAAAPGPVNMPTEAEIVATWPPVGPPMTLATLDLAASRKRRCVPLPTSSSTSRERSMPLPSRSAPPSTERSRTPSIPGSGRHRAGRHRYGSSPIRSKRMPKPCCVSTTTAARTEQRTGLPARSSRNGERDRAHQISSRTFSPGRRRPNTHHLAGSPPAIAAGASGGFSGGRSSPPPMRWRNTWYVQPW